jgi:hypothetical protein
MTLDWQLATAFHSRFRLIWLQKHDPECVSAVKETMELQVEACMKEEDEVAASSSSDISIEENPDDDCWYQDYHHTGTLSQDKDAYRSLYFQHRLQHPRNLVTLTLSNFFSFLRSPVYNDILKAKRASLADETFEMLKFMRGYKHHIMIFCAFFLIFS